MIDVYSLSALAVLLLSCGFALWKGDQLERAGAMALFVASVGSLFAQQDTGSFAPKLVLFAIDSALLAAFAVLAWRTPRSWPLFAAAFQLIKIIAHVAALMDLRVGTFAYISALNLSDYGVMVTLAVGAWNAWREREALKY